MCSRPERKRRQRAADHERFSWVSASPMAAAMGQPVAEVQRVARDVADRLSASPLSTRISGVLSVPFELKSEPSPFARRPVYVTNVPRLSDAPAETSYANALVYQRVFRARIGLPEEEPPPSLDDPYPWDEDRKTS